MRFPRLRGSTSVMIRVFIPDNSVTTGAGVTGLTNASTNLAIAYSRELQNGATQITGANLATITTIGTWASPGTGKLGFKAVDGTNLPGVYEIHFPDDAAAFGTGDTAQHVLINVLELTTAALKIGPNMVLIPLVPWNYQDGVRMGLTALPNAAAEAAGGLYTRGSGAGQITQDANGRIDANAKAWAGTATTLTGGLPDANAKTVSGAADVRTAVGLASANLDTQIAAVQSDTDNIQTRIPAALVGGRIDASVGAMATDVLTPQAVKSLGRGTAGAAGTTTSVTTSAFTPAGTATDQFKGRVILFDDDTTTTDLRGQATTISGSTIAANPTFTVVALTTAPASGDTFSVV